MWSQDQIKSVGRLWTFSPVAEETHPYVSYFSGLTSDLSWKKPRELPEWATEIFSPHIVAAGGISSEDELEQFCSTGIAAVRFYMEDLNSNAWQDGNSDFLPAQNKYCKNQKKNAQLYIALFWPWEFLCTIQSLTSMMFCSKKFRNILN